ncbi:MAG TPA: flagellar type III secretion system pore protein FliP [Acidimicrobiia bacterium]|jgi:flagellar biosynthetic protein FliP|nr:flagellar type III secretion system pore protein FliP [Acidimicrobiia bacterium]
MPTSRGRRALVASLLMLLACLSSGVVAAWADDPVTDPPPETPASSSTTVTTAAPATTTSSVAPSVTTSTVAPVTATTVKPSVVRGGPTTTTTVARTAAAPGGADATAAPALANTTTAGAPGAAPDTKASLSLDLGGVGGKPSQSLLIIVLITLLSVAPALLIMLTSFTRIVIVLSLTRNALGLHTIPPNQVIVGLAMFLSFFVMSPTFGDINRDAIQPLLKGEKTQAQAYDSAVTPLRTFMLKQTRKGELAMFSSAANGGQRPEKPEDVGLAALIPAFILSELKTAFIIGFVIFIPFLVIDIVVSSSLMSMGMMMLPPVFVSLPFKLLLFVMVDGWGLVVRSLLKSFA